MNTTTTQRPRRILWQNVLTVVSAATLIGAEVFGAAFAGSWAIATLLGLGTIGARLLDGLFVLCGIIVMVLFVRSARRIEQFVADDLDRCADECGRRELFGEVLGGLKYSLAARMSVRLAITTMPSATTSGEFVRLAGGRMAAIAR